jgi:hypothetical protein
MRAARMDSSSHHYRHSNYLHLHTAADRPASAHSHVFTSGRNAARSIIMHYSPSGLSPTALVLIKSKGSNTEDGHFI